MWFYMLIVEIFSCLNVYVIYRKNIEPNNLKGPAWSDAVCVSWYEKTALYFNDFRFFWVQLQKNTELI